MREILFRGKSKYGEDWVQGMYLHLNVGKDYICEGHVWIGTLNPCKEEVIPETVGQFTGLTDKNGKKIFEGDIIKNEYVEEKIQFLKIFFNETSLSWEAKNKYGFRGKLIHVIGSMEVIGNIHDNPELLEEGDS